MTEIFYECFRLLIFHFRQRAGLRFLRHHAIDATSVERLFQTAFKDLIAEIARDENLVLNDASIDVHNPQRAIRTGVGVHRTEALVGRGDELRLADARAGERGVRVADDVARDEIARRLAHEGVAAIILRKKFAPINRGAADSGITCKRAVVADLIFLVAAIHAGIRPDRIGGLVFHDLDVHPRRVAEIAIAPEVVRRHEIAAKLVAVVVVEEPTPVVLRDAPLPAKRRRLALELAVFIKAITERRLRVIEPVVHREQHPVRLMLHRPAARVFRIDLDLLHQLPVLLAAEPEVRRLGDEHAVASQRDRARQHEVIEEHGAPVHFSVAVRIFENDDVTRGPVVAAAVHVGHVTAHLANPEPPARVESHRDRRVDERLAGDQFDAEAMLDPERLQCGIGCERRGGRHREVPRGRRLVFALVIAMLGEKREWKERQRGGNRNAIFAVWNQGRGVFSGHEISAIN